MQDRNAKAPKVRSGDEINPVLGTIVKISVLVVIAALVVLTTLIVIEFTKRNKKEENVFKDKIHITENDFKIITDQEYRQNNGLSFDDLENEIKEIMDEIEPTKDIYFFFYYSDLSKDYDKDVTDLINSRDNKNPLFLIDLNIKEEEDEEGNKLPTIVDYLKTVESLSPASNNLEFTTIIERKESYKYFLVTYNEEVAGEHKNPFIILTNYNPIKDKVEDLLVKEEEED